MTEMIVKILEAPTQKDWCEVKRRALVTVLVNGL